MTPPVPARLVSSDIRGHNLGVVLTHLDRSGPAGRAQIAAATGLVRGSVTTLVLELQSAGLVRPLPVDSMESAGFGRPRERLEIDGAHLGVLGIQFAADEVLIYATDLAGRVLIREEHHLRTPFGDPSALIGLLVAHIELAVGYLRAAGTPAIALEVVLPGRIAAGSSLVTYSIELGWYGVDLGELLAPRLPRFAGGFAVSSDANMAAYAEYLSLRDDPANGRVTDMIFVKSDTGIGGGAIVDGRILTGSRGTAFEPGHVIVKPDGPRCECGKDGCLVTIAGPKAVIRAAGLDGYREHEGMPEALIELVRRYRSGDTAAVAAMADAASWIRIMLSNLIVTLEPQFVVLGGYFAEFTREFTPRVDSTIAILGTDTVEGKDAIRRSANGRLAAVEAAVAGRRRAFLGDPATLSALRSLP